MSRRFTNTLVFLVFCLGILAACGVILFNTVPELLRTGSRRLPDSREHTAEVEEVIEVRTPEAEPARPPALEETPLAIEGRAVDVSLRSLAGHVVLVGDESASVGKGGQFSLPAGERGPVQRVALLHGEREVAVWDEVLTAPMELDLPGDPRAVRPSVLRWSITAAREADGIDAGAVGAGEFLSVTAVLVEEWRPSGRIHIAGRTTLPDGLHVYSAIYLDGDRLVSSSDAGETTGGRFAFSYALPEDFSFFSGVYDLRVTFSTVLEAYQRMQMFRDLHPDIPWDELSEHEVHQPIYIGFVGEEAADNQRVEAYYRQTLVPVLRLKQILEARVGEAMNFARGWDPDLLLARQRTRSTGLVPALIGEDGEFTDLEWREFLDANWRPEVLELIDRHAATSSAKFPKANYRMERLLKSLLQVSYLDSRSVYRAFGLPPHENDRGHPVTMGVPDERTLLLKMMENDLQTLDALQTLTSRIQPGALPREREDVGEREKPSSGGAAPDSSPSRRRFR